MSKSMTASRIAGLALSAIVIGCWTADKSIAQSTSATQSGGTRSRSQPVNSCTYQDGVYTATGQYGGQPSFVTVTLTLADGVIRQVNVAPQATNPTSLDFQRRFSAAVPALVVGKRIDQVRVSRLAGSSGTPVGFNAAVQQIKKQAGRGC